jgi:ribosomal silencing factor RsfS
VPDYDLDEATLIASLAYPIYVDARGHSAMDAIVTRIRSACKREVQTPSEVEVDKSGAYLVAGVFTRIKLFPGEAGKTALAVIGSTDGSEVVVRIDTDVLDAGSRVLATTGQVVVAAVTVSDRGRVGLEAIWTANEVLDPGTDVVRRFVAHPPRTTPRDPRKQVGLIAEEGKAWIEGMVIRVRKGKDKNGGPMRTLTILGERSFVRMMVFASRMHKDVTSITSGKFIEVRVQKMKGEAVFLTDSEIKEISDPWAGVP